MMMMSMSRTRPPPQAAAMIIVKLELLLVFSCPVFVTLVGGVVGGRSAQKVENGCSHVQKLLNY